MEKIKLMLESKQGKDILVVLIVILVGIGSFELGRLSKSDRNPGIRIEYPEEPALEANAVSSTLGKEDVRAAAEAAPGKGFFASSRGQKYYPIDCAAGKNIKTENRVWFDTREEAENRGYELSGSCN